MALQPVNPEIDPARVRVDGSRRHPLTFAARCLETLLLAALVELSCGCATPSRPATIRQGESVVIVVVSAAAQPGDPVTIRNRDLTKDSGIGAGSGAAAGALWGLACGPFAPLCMIVGAGAGAVTGGALGAGAGMTAALSHDQATRLRERLSRVQASHDLPQELRTQLAQRAQSHWNLGADPSTFTVTVELQDMVLSSNRDERIGLVVRALVSVRSSEAAATNPVATRMYHYPIPQAALDVWLDDSNDFIDTHLSAASSQLAARIVSDLAFN